MQLQALRQQQQLQQQQRRTRVVSGVRRRLLRQPPRAQAAGAEGAAALPLGAGGGSKAASSSSISDGAVYIRSQQLAPGVLEYPDRSVVVVGDVPAGCVVRAGGDVVVLGTLAGEAAAGVGGDTGAVVLLNQLGRGAALSIAGRPAAAAAAAGDGSSSGADLTPPPRTTQLMLVLQPGAAAPAFVAMPGTPALGGPGAAAAAPGVVVSLARVAAALGVLSLGLALLLQPGSVLGGLLSTNAESVTGALLDAFVFGFLILRGAGLLADGSELLLEVVEPGIIGGVVLPLLGALPDALIVLSSLNATREAAAETVAVGIGTLAGSTILLLSVAWGASVALGACDLDPVTRVARDKTLSRRWDWANTGVTVDRDVRQGAIIMAASVLLYGSVQVPAFLGATEAPTAALIGAVACLGSCLAYLIYSVLFPQLQQRRIGAARRKRFRMVAVRALALRSAQVAGGSSLVDPSGRLNRATAAAIFEEFDKDGSGAIDSAEVQGLLLGLQLAGSSGSSTAGSVDKEALDYMMREFDTDADRTISRAEFEAVLERWVEERMTTAAGGSTRGSQRFTALLDPRTGGAAASVLADLPPDDLAALQETAAELEDESAEDAADDMQDEGSAEQLSTRDIVLRSIIRMGGGIALCAVFSDPLVEALTALSRATGIPAFVVGFVLTPLASNSSELVSSLTFAGRKRRRAISLTMAQVYGAVTLNSTLVLGLFLLVVYKQQLPWVYSSEVAAVVTSTVAIAAVGSSRTTFPLWMAVPALLLYPASLTGIHLLDTLLGWQ